MKSKINITKRNVTLGLCSAIALSSLPVGTVVPVISNIGAVNVMAETYVSSIVTFDDAKITKVVGSETDEINSDDNLIETEEVTITTEDLTFGQSIIVYKTSDDDTTVEVTHNTEDNTFTFTMPDYPVTIEVADPISSTVTFDDTKITKVVGDETDEISSDDDLIETEEVTVTTEDLTFAQSIIVYKTGDSDATVEVTHNTEDNTFTFTMPDYPVTIEVADPISSTVTFDDTKITKVVGSETDEINSDDNLIETEEVTITTQDLTFGQSIIVYKTGDNDATVEVTHNTEDDTFTFTMPNYPITIKIADAVSSVATFNDTEIIEVEGSTTGTISTNDNLVAGEKITVTTETLSGKKVVVYKNGNIDNSIIVTSVSDTEHTFTMPDYAIEIKVEVSEYVLTADGSTSGKIDFTYYDAESESDVRISFNGTTADVPTGVAVTGTVTLDEGKDVYINDIAQNIVTGEEKTFTFTMNSAISVKIDDAVSEFTLTVDSIDTANDIEFTYTNPDTNEKETADFGSGTTVDIPIGVTVTGTVTLDEGKDIYINDIAQNLITGEEKTFTFTMDSAISIKIDDAISEFILTVDSVSTANDIEFTYTDPDTNEKETADFGSGTTVNIPVGVTVTGIVTLDEGKDVYIDNVAEGLTADSSTQETFTFTMNNNISIKIDDVISDENEDNDSNNNSDNNSSTGTLPEPEEEIVPNVKPTFAFEVNSNGEITKITLLTGVWNGIITIEKNAVGINTTARSTSMLDVSGISEDVTIYNGTTDITSDVSNLIVEAELSKPLNLSSFSGLTNLDLTNATTSVDNVNVILPTNSGYTLENLAYPSDKNINFNNAAIGEINIALENDTLTLVANNSDAEDKLLEDAKGSLNLLSGSTHILSIDDAYQVGFAKDITDKFILTNSIVTLKVYDEDGDNGNGKFLPVTDNGSVTLENTSLLYSNLTYSAGGNALGIEAEETYSFEKGGLVPFNVEVKFIVNTNEKSAKTQLVADVTSFEVSASNKNLNTSAKSYDELVANITLVDTENDNRDDNLTDGSDDFEIRWYASSSKNDFTYAVNLSSLGNNDTLVIPSLDKYNELIENAGGTALTGNQTMYIRATILDENGSEIRHSENDIFTTTISNDNTIEEVTNANVIYTDGNVDYTITETKHTNVSNNEVSYTYKAIATINTTDIETLIDFVLLDELTSIMLTSANNTTDAEDKFENASILTPATVSLNSNSLDLSSAVALQSAILIDEVESVTIGSANNLTITSPTNNTITVNATNSNNITVNAAKATEIVISGAVDSTATVTGSNALLDITVNSATDLIIKNAATSIIVGGASLNTITVHNSITKLTLNNGIKINNPVTIKTSTNETVFAGTPTVTSSNSSNIDIAGSNNLYTFTSNNGSVTSPVVISLSIGDAPEDVLAVTVTYKGIKYTFTLGLTNEPASISRDVASITNSIYTISKIEASVANLSGVTDVYLPQYLTKDFINYGDFIGDNTFTEFTKDDLENLFTSGAAAENIKVNLVDSNGNDTNTLLLTDGTNIEKITVLNTDVDTIKLTGTTKSSVIINCVNSVKDIDIYGNTSFLTLSRVNEDNTSSSNPAAFNNITLSGSFIPYVQIDAGGSEIGMITLDSHITSFYLKNGVAGDTITVKHDNNIYNCTVLTSGTASLPNLSSGNNFYSNYNSSSSSSSSSNLSGSSSGTSSGSSGNSAFLENSPTESGAKLFAAFTDVKGHWAYNSIKFMVEREYLFGTGNNKFSPNDNMSRAMFVTALSRIDGQDVDDSVASTFTDVAADKWYSGAINWATDIDLTAGMPDGSFDPYGNVTREQMAVFIDNYISDMGLKLPATEATINFVDNNSISSWAKDSVSAMQVAGVLSGYPDGSFDPQGTATRAEVCSMLERFVKLVVELGEW